jgi:hypothetical protein
MQNKIKQKKEGMVKDSNRVYEMVQSLRNARAKRLGALQRKLPAGHIVLLVILGILQLSAFPLMGARTQSIGDQHKFLTIEGFYFAFLTSTFVLTLLLIYELWTPSGGLYNVDSTLKIMVEGLETELSAHVESAVPSLPRL